MVGEGHLPKVHPTQWVQAQKENMRIATQAQCQPDTVTVTKTEKPWDYFRQDFLHTPTCPQLLSVTFKSSTCPTSTTDPGIRPSTASHPQGQQYYPWVQIQTRPSALEWWKTCFGHPARAFHPLTTYVWNTNKFSFHGHGELFYLTLGIEM